MEDNSCNSGDGLDYHELEHALFDTTEEDLVGLNRCSLVEGPWLLDSSLELQVYDQLVWPAQEVDEQVHENIENVRLITISDGIDG
jgi:hypothetical protein